MGFRLASLFISLFDFVTRGGVGGGEGEGGFAGGSSDSGLWAFFEVCGLSTFSFDCAEGFGAEDGEDEGRSAGNLKGEMKASGGESGIVVTSGAQKAGITVGEAEDESILFTRLRSLVPFSFASVAVAALRSALSGTGGSSQFQFQ